MNFRDLRVWRAGVGLVSNVYRLTAGFPTAERFGITSQMRRAAISIPANIAEGHGRASTGEFLNQLSIARGSANELETLLHVAKQLSMADDTQLQPIANELDAVQRMIVTLRSRLLQSQKGKKVSNR